MTKFGIVDDNKEQRESLKIQMQIALKKKGVSIPIIDIFPFAEYNEYNKWIEANKISLLIFDERLNNDSEGTNGPVAYKGNELVIKIRENFKDIPIFTVTAHTDDEELQSKFNEFDFIINRDDFNEKHIDIILRASQRYLNENQKELAEFDTLTKKIAVGGFEANELERLRALQLKLNIPSTNDLQDREGWLQEYENQINNLETIKNKLLEKIDKA